MHPPRLAAETLDMYTETEYSVPFGQSRQNGEEPLHGQQVDCAQRAVDWKGCLGQQRTDGLKHVAALYAAVQIGVDVSDEARLTAEIQQPLPQQNGLSERFRRIQGVSFLCM